MAFGVFHKEDNSQTPCSNSATIPLECHNILSRIPQFIDLVGRSHKITTINQLAQPEQYTAFCFTYNKEFPAYSYA